MKTHSFRYAVEISVLYVV